MNIESWKKSDRLLQVIRLFERGKRRWRTREIAEQLGVNEDTAQKYLRELSFSGLLPLANENHVWFLPDGAVIPKLEVSLSYPEGVGLYLAGRLLAQMQDKPNWHISMALKKLVEAMPPSMKAQQETLLEIVSSEPDEQRDVSSIFQVLACAWMTQRRVRLSYSPPGKKTFECFFDPYLLEPSAVGHTIYAIGLSSAPQAVRTYKLERIQWAEPTNTSFDIPADFDGAALLQKSWGVMFGDEEPVQVRLHFSAEVTPRVRETRWHPSQNVSLTRDGCEWTCCIGDTLEIEPWIRSWGGDCEVIEPVELRNRMLQHLHRSMKRYGVTAATSHHPTTFDRHLFRKE